MHKCERHTGDSSMKSLKRGQTYDPYKAQGLCSRTAFAELFLFPNPVHMRSEHVHISVFSLIPSAVILHSALSFTKYTHILGFVIKTLKFSYFIFWNWPFYREVGNHFSYWECGIVWLDRALQMAQSNPFSLLWFSGYKWENWYPEMLNYVIRSLVSKSRLETRSSNS